MYRCKPHYQSGKRNLLGRGDNTEHQVSQTSLGNTFQIEINSSMAGIWSYYIDSADVWTI
ncbi:Uncharacterised protein [Serratia quinivorans]|nr:Uncharacterised protein [Serratia quinivorans]